MNLTRLGLLLLLMFSSPATAGQTAAIGHIQTLQGNASIQRGSGALAAVVGTRLWPGDVIRTDTPGAVGIVLTDNTTISLGSNSEIVLREYDFNPKEGRYALALRMVKGTFVYVSGLIGKLAPDATRLSIPDATIAVRGTKLLIEVQD